MMEETTLSGGPKRQGAPSRVLRELIRTPAFRELLKLALQESTPGGGAELARAALREDVEVSLSVIGSLPRALDYLADFLLETLRQLSLFPAPVLREFLGQMGAAADKDKLADIEEEMSRLAGELLWEDPAAMRALRLRLVKALNAALWACSETMDRLLDAPPGDGPSETADPQAVAEMANSLLRAMARAHSRRPRFLAEVALFMDREALEQGAEAMLSSAMQVMPALLSAIAGAFFHKYKSKVKILIYGAVALIFAPLFIKSAKGIVRLKGGR